MDLIHQNLIKYLPLDILLQLHRRCCFLRGTAWGNSRYSKYIFNYPFSYLFFYHWIVANRINELKKDSDVVPYIEYDWLIHNYRGNVLHYQSPTDEIMKNGWHDVIIMMNVYGQVPESVNPVYKEHNNTLLRKNLLTFMKKGITLEGTTPEELLIRLDLNGNESI